MGPKPSPAQPSRPWPAGGLPAREGRVRRHHLLAALLLAGTAAAAPPPGRAPASPAASGALIYSCVDAQGQAQRADRPIPACQDREQRVLQRDGSLRGVLPPAATPAEQASAAARAREQAAQAEARRDALRRERSLLARYPDESRHEAARRQALQALDAADALSARRVAELQRQRARLEQEASFHAGRELPAALRRELAAVDASLEAQQRTAEVRAADRRRVDAHFQEERALLQPRWDAARLSRPASSSAAR